MSLPEREPPSSLGMRPAFTVVELLVAIIVFTIGLLALAATAGLVAAHVGDGGRLTDAAHSARSILDSLAAHECGEIMSGSSVRTGVAAEWVVARDTVAARIELTVGSQLRRGPRRDSYQSVVPCARD